MPQRNHALAISTIPPQRRAVAVLAFATVLTSTTTTTTGTTGVRTRASS